MKSWTWRQAVICSDLPATTRHVLLTLSCHINDMGESAYPSTRLLAKETGLSERAVITHLKIATEKGWLKVTRHGYGDQRWARHEYEPLEPSVEEKALNDVQYEGAEPDAKGTEPHSEGAEPASVPRNEKALNDVQSNSENNIYIPPIVPQTKKQRRGSKVTLKTWLANLEAAGEDALPAADPIFGYAAESKIPEEFLFYAWVAFKQQYLDGDKKYIDWRATFRNAVRGNWSRVWWIDQEGNYCLSTVGKQIQIAQGVSA